ncbi:MAG: nuclear transport factor 2 family protein [Rhodothermales bacterium]
MKRTGTGIVATGLFALIVLLGAFSRIERTQDDKQAILDHIHSIFKAYMEGDEATIHATHSDNWTGFNNQSRSIVRGIDAYMENARRSLSGARIVRYELEDVDIQIHGDIGVAYYVANWTIKLNASETRVRLHARSVDIYQKRSGDWIQIGSNLNVLSLPGSMAKPECGACFDVALEDQP